MAFKILGTGSSKSTNIVTNDQLAEIMDTSDEWITSKTGIKQRNIAKNEGVTDLALMASEEALASSNINASEIDMIIGATMTGDFRTPSLAAMLTKRLGIKCPAFDVNVACSGFIYALDIAESYFLKGKVKKVLVVCSEMMSRLVDWTDRATSVLFGDGAGAVVLGEGNNFLSSKLTCEGNEEVLSIKSPNANLYNECDDDCYLKMNGQEVYRFAVSAMCNDVEEVVANAGFCMSDVKAILPHQANLRIIDAATKKLKIDSDKVLRNIQNHGNMSAASIPVMLDEFNKKGAFSEGDILVLSAFGGGLTTGACVIRW